MDRRLFRSAVIGCLMMVLLLVGCSGPVGTPTAVPTPTPTPAPTPATAQEYMKAMEDALNAAGTYHFDMDGAVSLDLPSQEMKLDIPMTLAGDVQAPDKMQGSLTMSMMGSSISTDMIVIGNQAWAKDPTTGEWVASPQAAAPVTPGQFTNLSESDLAAMKVVGEETLDGQQVIHVSGSVNQELDLGTELGGPMQMSLASDYWLAKETNLPIKASVVGNVPIAQEGLEMTVGMSLTLQFSGFGEAVTIEPPPMASPTP
jgi:hypothetical protein